MMGCCIRVAVSGLDATLPNILVKLRPSVQSMLLYAMYRSPRREPIMWPGNPSANLWAWGGCTTQVLLCM
ncbi:hypothetical protein CORC01_14048 [Colletotrichum orchidophilum]|uniref:Uncharacterized protein n=1 Tax=Colletotrichum orchidophilum TaxID=1209926 RepID=A0A1G4ANA8_9PEZI|nr:uncharacterized protein CORC01_14048 [Colletotrichum orchidophilum]OHE90659.1 hypothetical protein CORC01_14048 [Colletotrichum orchidophilum]